MEWAILIAAGLVVYALVAPSRSELGPAPAGFLPFGSPSPSSPRVSAISPDQPVYSSIPGSGIGAQQSIGIAGGVGAPVAALLGAGVAVPIIGAAVAGVGAVLGIISAHHKEAVAKEGRGMAVAIAHWNQGLAILVSASAQKVYGGPVARTINVPLMEQHLNQLYGDYKSIVGPIIKGSPAITPPQLVGTQFKDATWAGGTDPCNGPCSYAKNYIAPQWSQAFRMMVLGAMGQHHTFTIPPLAPNAAKQFPGAQGVSVSF